VLNVPAKATLFLANACTVLSVELPTAGSSKERQKVLSKNDAVARVLREDFQKAGVTVISLVSSPGSGKTAFLERILTILAKDFRVAALVGDLATENDAVRLARSGAPVKQISTGTICHLDANMVVNSLGDWSLPDLDFLFIENVGNLVCPASYDLGEAARMVLLSVTEGEDKPLKYPSIFHTADVAVITKVDLAAPVEFDAELARRNINSVRPGIPIFESSVKTEAGLTDILDWMKTLRRASTDHL
jgi:hydrogenase nickel incorporation protein HypB